MTEERKEGWWGGRRHWFSIRVAQTRKGEGAGPRREKREREGQGGRERSGRRCGRRKKRERCVGGPEYARELGQGWIRLFHGPRGGLSHAVRVTG